MLQCSENPSVNKEPRRPRAAWSFIDKTAVAVYDSPGFSHLYAACRLCRIGARIILSFGRKKGYFPCQYLPNVETASMRWLPHWFFANVKINNHGFR